MVNRMQEGCSHLIASHCLINRPQPSSSLHVQLVFLTLPLAKPSSPTFILSFSQFYINFSMASLKADQMTKEPEETGEMSPTAEETELAPTDKDTITPPTESETKEIPVSEEEKEKQPPEEEDEKPDESWPIIEEAAPDTSFEAASGGTTHDFGEDEDEDEDD